MEAYFIHVRFRSSVPLPLRYQEHKDELFVSPNARLAGLSGMAQLESRDLAEQFVGLIYPIFHKRYGSDVAFEIGSGRCNREKEVALVKSHSEIVRARIEESNTASNKTPRARSAKTSPQTLRS